MKERILHFPSGAKVIFEGNLDGRDGYTLYIWPDQLDECAEITEAQWEYLLKQAKGEANDMPSKEQSVDRDKFGKDSK